MHRRRNQQATVTGANVDMIGEHLLVRLADYTPVSTKRQRLPGKTTHTQDRAVSAKHQRRDTVSFASTAPSLFISLIEDLSAFQHGRPRKILVLASTPLTLATNEQRRS